MNKFLHHLIEVDEATANAEDFGEQIQKTVEQIRALDLENLIGTQDTRQVAKMFLSIIDDLNTYAFGIVNNLKHRNQKALDELFNIAGVQRA